MEVIFKLKPEKLESLSSFFRRLGKKNYYEERNWFVYCFNLPRYTRPNFISEPLQLSTISSGIKLEVNSIQQMTVHCFAKYFYTTLMKQHWEESQRNIFLGKSKICDACLDESGIPMLPWALRPITMCLEHDKLLVDLVPHQRERDLGLASKMVSPLLRDLTWSAIDCHPQSFSEINATTLSRRELTPPLFFRYLWHMGKLLLEHLPKNSFFDADRFIVDDRRMDIGRLRNYDLHTVLCASVWTLSEWPSHFHETLEHILDVKAIAKKSGLKKHSFLYEFRRSFDIAGYKWVWIEIEKFTNSTNYSKGRHWKRYVRRVSKRESDKPRHTPQPAQSIELADVQKLSLSEASRMLDIPARELKRLTSTGIIETISKDRLGQRNKWIFAQNQFKFLLGKIQSLAIPVNVEEEDFLPIFDAVKSLRPRGVSYADLLKSILEGGLQPYYSHDIKTLTGVFVTKTGLNQYVDQLLGEEWSFDRTIMYFGMSPASIIRFHQLRILIPSRHEGDEDYRLWKYAKKNVCDFQSKYINSAQATKIIRCPKRTVLYWAKQRWLPAVCGPSIDGSRTYLFDKEEVTRWRFERIKSDEAKQLLSIKQRTMEDWIAKGILHPLKDMSVHPYWFAREEIESLRVKDK